jgi:integrase
MPRRPKPFFRRGWWCSHVGGTRTKLAKGRDGRAAAEDSLLDLLQGLRTSANRKTFPQLTVFDLCDQFLDWVEVNRAKGTYDDYRRRLNKWQKHHGKKRARELSKLDLEEWKTFLAGQYPSNCSTNHHIKAVKACWSWAVENELLPANAFSKVKDLYAEGRERIVTAEEFRSLLRNADALFRQVLIFCRLTGVRSSQFCQMTWSQINFEAHVIVIRHHKPRRTAKQKKRSWFRWFPFDDLVGNRFSDFDLSRHRVVSVKVG